MRRLLLCGGLSGLGVVLVLASVVFAASPVAVWPGASELALPANANPTAGHQNAVLNSVVCPSAGHCVAVGDYNDTTGRTQALLATQSAGGAWQASELTLPGNANPGAGAQSVDLNSLVCPSAGTCVATGHYRDTTGSVQAMVATQSAGGAWQASQLTLPGNADTTAGAQNASLRSVVCTSAGTCVATGFYTDTTGSFQALVATQSAGGAWQASGLTLPGNADTTAGAQSASLGSVVCPSAGTCAAPGGYKDTAGNGQALVATQSAGGAWQASELTLPGNADTDAGDQNASLNSVACTSAGNCAAAGSYEDTAGSRQALVATQSAGGAWQTSELTQPANTTAGDQNAFLNSLVCASAGYCTAAGFYKDTTGSFQAMVVSSVAALGVGTSSVPSGVDGSAYSARLSSTGGAGGGTWSLSSGSLPAGLSLNASTGVISGVPRAVGRSSFTVSVSDPGPPVQHASVSLSIAVGPAPPAGIRQVKTSGSLVTLTLVCHGSAGQTCSGTLKLSALEHLTGHTITAVTASKPKKTTKPKKPKPRKTTKTVTLASTTYAFTGARRTLKITLNKTGKHLLAKYHKLSAKLTLTSTGARTPAATTTITFKAPPAKHKHR